MTKYILHGGATSRPLKSNRDFFFEMTKGISNPVKVLCVYFSKEKKFWEELFNQDKESFSSASPTKILRFTCAEDDPKIFREQIQKTDVIYMRGGSSDKLLNALKPIEDFDKLIQNKVVSGSSAGVLILSKYYYSGFPSAGSVSKIKKGLNILPIKTFVHYTKEKIKDLQNLDNYREKLPVYKIPEGKFFVIEQ